MRIQKGNKKETPNRKTTPLVEDVENNLDDIMIPLLKKNKKIVGGKNIPINVPIAHLNNVSFHYKESFLKWKFVYHRRITPEKEPSKEAFKCEENFEILMDTQILKIVSNLNHIILSLSKNSLSIMKDFNNVGSKTSERSIFEVGVLDSLLLLSMSILEKAS